MFEFECVITWYTVYDALWHYHNCTLTCYSTAIAMPHGSALMFVLIKCLERYHVGFGWTAGTLVLVHVWIWMCHYLVYDAPWKTRLELQTRLLLFNDNDNDILRLCADVDDNSIWYGTISCWLSTNRKYVGIGACLDLNASLLGIGVPTMHGNNIWFYADVDVDWIYGTVSYWLWTNREYVGIGACLNLNVSLLGIRCTMNNTTAITHSPVIQLQWQWQMTPRWCCC